MIWFDLIFLFFFFLFLLFSFSFFPFFSFFLYFPSIFFFLSLNIFQGYDPKLPILKGRCTHIVLKHLFHLVLALAWNRHSSFWKLRLYVADGLVQTFYFLFQNGCLLLHLCALCLQFLAVFSTCGWCENESKRIEPQIYYNMKKRNVIFN